ncbi:MAG: RagB/SusD family nutrient uptake outer membrane protein [Bacteroidales bacterium]|nr:RagB/SusD family nutrient uptake outer membrane protein [Bacteroidales bacterium]MCU0408043.1 RagB/SusD family nutrient uptake outer membrane protein [Bacteroidales bacterium]
MGIFLNYAEVFNELEGVNFQPGLDTLNLLRNRTGLPDNVIADLAVARDCLHQERFVGFFGEGHRWHDMRRWMIAPTVVTDAYEMKIKQFGNGNYEWKIGLTAKQDIWVWKNNKCYWLPLSRDELK